MKRPVREINIFNLSMLDVMTGALGAVMIVMIVLLTQKIGIESMSCQDLKTELVESGERLAEAKRELKSARNDLAGLKEEREKAVEKISGTAKLLGTIAASYDSTISKISELSRRLFLTPEDSDQLLAFKIPGRIVMLIDLSGSMSAKNNRYKEDRLSQIKAALKMFIAAMDERYWLDIVYFPAFKENLNEKQFPGFKIRPGPSGKCSKFEFRDEAYDDTSLDCYKYGYFEGKLINLTAETDKHVFYRKIACLEPYHDTPTEEALRFVLSHPEYSEAEGIILYSDGEPDSIRKKIKTKNELLSSIKKMNSGNKKIFTVGVGTEFANNEDTEAVDFLKKLAEQNGGFYIGF